MRRHRLGLLVAVLAFAGLTCRGCLKEGPGNVLDLTAPDTLATVLVPDLGGFAAGVDAFVNGATRKAGAESVQRMKASLATQLGFDPFNVEGYEALGLDADGPCLVFTEGDFPEPLLVFTVTEAKVFDETIKKVLKSTDGASKVTTAQVAGHTVSTLGRPFGTDVVPAFHWAYIGRFAITARAQGRAALDAALTRISASDPGGQSASLRTDPLYRELARKVESSGMNVFIRGKAAMQLLSSPESVSRGAITNVQVDSKGLRADTFIDLQVEGIEAALAGEPVLALADGVSKDAALLALTRAARADGVTALRAHAGIAKVLDKALGPLATQIGVDLDKEVMPLLAGPMTFSVHVGDLAGMLPRLRQSRSLSTLLDFFHIVVTAEVKDADAFMKVLDRSRQSLASRGIPLRRRTVKKETFEATVFEPDRPQPRLGWALSGTRYIYAAGAGRVDAVLDTLAGGPSGLTADLAGTVGGDLGKRKDATLVVLRTGLVVDAAERITLGQQGSGIGIGALIGAGLQLLRTVGDVALTLGAEPGGLRLKVRERLQ